MNKKKNMIIGTLLVLIVVMGVAYAAFASNLNINGTANINSTWDLRITNIKELSKTSGVTITSAPTYTGTTATFNVDLTSPGDSIEYQVTVENKGTLDALLESITANKTANNSINFEVTGINKGDSLNSNTSKIVTINISYVQTAGSGVKEENNLSISMTFVQDLGQEITPETPIVTLPIPSEACFAFNSSTGTITDYYDNKGNNTNNPSCPRSLAIPGAIGGVSVTTIGYAAFWNNQLTSIVIPSSVMEIGNQAFDGNKLSSVVIPLSVTTIGQAAFNSNQLPDSQAFIYKRNSDGTEDKTTIVSYGGANKNIIIPSSVTVIGKSAFGWNNLKSIEIPSSVTTIGNSAFGSNRLTSVTIKGKSSSSDFLTYGTDIWGWADGYSDSNIVWNG